MTQSPLRPPTTKAAFKTPGQTATASAPSSNSRGMALSGTDITLVSTTAASFEWRAASAVLVLLTSAFAPFLCADALAKERHTAASAATASNKLRFDRVNTIPSFGMRDARAPSCPLRSRHSSFRLRLETPKAQAVRHDRDGRELHRSARVDGFERPAQHRVERARREWDAENVVDERPEKILFYHAHRLAREGDGRHHSAQRAADERDTCGLDGDVRARSDGYSNVGLRERGRVVDAVADHRNDLTFGL